MTLKKKRDRFKTTSGKKNPWDTRVEKSYDPRPKYRDSSENMIHWHREEGATEPFYHDMQTNATLRVTSNMEWVSCRLCLECLVRDAYLPETVLDAVSLSKRRAMARERPV